MEYEGHSMCIVNGYYDVYFPEHPNARKNGCVMLQVLVAEKMLGRPLRKDEVVHHKDKNRLNNSEGNLMVFASLSDHTNYHSYVLNGCDADFVLYRNNGVYTCQPSIAFFNQNAVRNRFGNYMKPCPQCGKFILMQSSSCPQCYRVLERRVERPTRHQLKTEIRNMPFTTLAQKYGVSDNAIRKWCKQYGLPYKSSEIRKLTKEEWKYI